MHLLAFPPTSFNFIEDSKRSYSVVGEDAPLLAGGKVTIPEKMLTPNLLAAQQDQGDCSRRHSGQATPPAELCYVLLCTGGSQ